MARGTPDLSGSLGSQEKEVGSNGAKASVGAVICAADTESPHWSKTAQVLNVKTLSVAKANTSYTVYTSTHDCVPGTYRSAKGTQRAGVPFQTLAIIVPLCLGLALLSAN